ncbi:MAG: PaaI family thioesterase [Candidatus Omnitrophota bacterium]
MRKIDLADDNFCFVCGKKNKYGLRIDFELTPDEKLKAEFTPEKIHQGFKDIVHGGIIGMILDEAMVNLLWKLGITAVTADLNLRLVKPAIVNKKLFFEAKIKEKQKKIIITEAICKNEKGQKIAQANAKCLKV